MRGRYPYLEHAADCLARGFIIDNPLMLSEIAKEAEKKEADEAKQVVRDTRKEARCANPPVDWIARKRACLLFVCLYL